ncbi:MAG: hypothetical protein GY719_15895 [bacterium]|nr:hypothetical protein [bacterium]
MHDLLADFRRSFRQLWRSPGFTLPAMLCLALGIGANTAVFSFADALLARLTAVAESERLVRAFVDWSNGLELGAFSYPDYAVLSLVALGSCVLLIAVLVLFSRR